MIVGLHGKKGTGKDTIAKHLIDEYGFVKVAFADKLKEAVANLFDITVEDVDLFKENAGNSIDLVEVHLDVVPAEEDQIGYEYVFTWRTFLQRFGTEMGRDTFGQDFWLDQWVNTIRDLQMMSSEYRPIVVTDVRFENEARQVLVEGGWIVEVTRPGHISDGHASEEDLPEDLIDAWIDNNSTIESLYQDVDKFMEDATSGRITR